MRGMASFFAPAIPLTPFTPLIPLRASRRGEGTHKRLPRPHAPPLHPRRERNGTPIQPPVVDRAESQDPGDVFAGFLRSEEHTSELQSLMRISYAVFCLKTKINNKYHND